MENVFIVHGPKEGKLLVKVIDAISSKGFNPIVLEQETVNGMLLDVAVAKMRESQKAVIICSGKDLGIYHYSTREDVVQKSKLKLRARENVVFECGFLLAHLGIENLFFILGDGMSTENLPSDLQGIRFYRSSQKNLISSLRAFLSK